MSRINIKYADKSLPAYLKTNIIGIGMCKFIHTLVYVISTNKCIFCKIFYINILTISLLSISSLIFQVVSIMILQHYSIF